MGNVCNFWISIKLLFLANSKKHVKLNKFSHLEISMGLSILSADLVHFIYNYININSENVYLFTNTILII